MMQNNQAIPFNKDNFKQIFSVPFVLVIIISIPSAIIALGIDIMMTDINGIENICLKFSLLKGIAWLFCIIHDFRIYRNW